MSSDKKIEVENIFFLLLVLFFALSNIQAVLSLYSKNIQVSEQVNLFKIAREAGIFVLMLYVLLKGFLKKAHVLLAFYFFMFIISIRNVEAIALLWGMRFLFPLFVLIVPYNKNIYFKNIQWIKKILVWLLVFHVLLQVVHLFWGNGYYSYMMLTSLNARNPGLLYYPAASAFLTLSLFVAIYSVDQKIKYLPVVCASILLCSSITGVVTLLILVLLLHEKLSLINKLISGIYFAGAFISLHVARYSMTGNTYLQETAGGRAKVFSDVTSNLKFGFFNNDFGLYTNGYAGHFGGGVVDSLYSALFSNLTFGWLLFTVAMLAYFTLLQKNLIKDTRGKLIVALFVLSSVGVITTEATFPFLMLILAKVFILQGVECSRIQITREKLKGAN